MSKIKQSTTCGHPDRKNVSKGRCSNCYDKFRRPKKPKKLPTCGHDGPIWGHGLCRPCYEKVNKEKISSCTKAYRSIHKDKYKTLAHGYNVKRFGMTTEEYDKMLKSQNGLCALCGKQETVKRGGKVIQLSIDHAHVCCPSKGSCGKCNRGLLCFNCNRLLGCVNDSEETLKAAITYLRAFRAVEDL